MIVVALSPSQPVSRVIVTTGPPDDGDYRLRDFSLTHGGQGGSSRPDSSRHSLFRRLSFNQVRLRRVDSAGMAAMIGTTRKRKLTSELRITEEKQTTSPRIATGDITEEVERQLHEQFST